jgi:hypothetical protein
MVVGRCLFSSFAMTMMDGDLFSFVGGGGNSEYHNFARVFENF